MGRPATARTPATAGRPSAAGKSATVVRKLAAETHKKFAAIYNKS